MMEGVQKTEIVSCTNRGTACRGVLVDESGGIATNRTLTGNRFSCVKCGEQQGDIVASMWVRDFGTFERVEGDRGCDVFLLTPDEGGGA